MVARGVSVDGAVFVAQYAEVVKEVVEVAFVVSMTERERANDVDERCAVEGIECDAESLLVAGFEGSCAVGGVDELLGEPQYVGALYCGGVGLLEQVCEACGVLWCVERLCEDSEQCTMECAQCEQGEAFHGSKGKGRICVAVGIGRRNVYKCWCAYVSQHSP